MMYHDNGFGGGNHWGLWVLMIVAMVIFWVALAWIIVTLVRHRSTSPGSTLPAPGSGSTQAGSGSTQAGPDALRILDERLARGDIDEDEYTRRRSLIEGPR